MENKIINENNLQVSAASCNITSHFVLHVHRNMRSLGPDQMVVVTAGRGEVTSTEVKTQREIVRGEIVRERHGTHGTGKTGKIVKKNLCQGKHREFGNFAKTQGKHRELRLLKL